MQKATYTLEEFAEKFSLDENDAKRIYAISGPSSVNLDVFMKVYKKRQAAEGLLFGTR